VIVDAIKLEQLNDNLKALGIGVRSELRTRLDALSARWRSPISARGSGVWT